MSRKGWLLLGGVAVAAVVVPLAVRHCLQVMARPRDLGEAIDLCQRRVARNGAPVAGSPCQDEASCHDAACAAA